MNKHGHHKLPKVIADEIAKDILEASDQEILEVSKDIYTDVDGEAEKIKALIMSAVLNSNKEKLKLAQKELQDRQLKNNQLGVLKLNIKTKKDVIKRAKDASSSLTLAARNNEAITDSDTDSYLMDLFELGVIDEDGNLKK